MDYLGLNVAGARSITGGERIECKHATKEFLVTDTWHGENGFCKSQSS